MKNFFKRWYELEARRSSAEVRQENKLFAFLALAILIAVATLFSGCAGSRVPQETPGTPRSVRIIPPQQGLPGRVDSLSITAAIKEKEIKETEKKTPSIISRATSFLFGGKKTTKETVQNSPNGLPKKCKGCTFYYAPATVTTIGKKATAAVGDEASATVIGKKAGPSITNSDSATQAVTQGGAAAIGPGAHAEGGAVVEEAPGFWATLAKPLGYLVCAVGAAAAVYLIYLIWAYLPRRKTDNQA